MCPDCPAELDNGCCPNCGYDSGFTPERRAGADSRSSSGSVADWERRYRELETVHAVFATAVRKALKIETEQPLTTILDVLIAVKRSSDAYMESKYGIYGKYDKH